MNTERTDRLKSAINDKHLRLTQIINELVSIFADIEPNEDRVYILKKEFFRIESDTTILLFQLEKSDFKLYCKFMNMHESLEEAVSQVIATIENMIDDNKAKKSSQEQKGRRSFLG